MKIIFKTGNLYFEKECPSFVALGATVRLNGMGYVAKAVFWDADAEPEMVYRVELGPLRHQKLP